MIKMPSNLDFIAITGTRRRSEALSRAGDALWKELIGGGFLGVVIHGGATGADGIAGPFSRAWCISANPWPFGKETGPIRNAGIAGIVAELLLRGKRGRGFAFPDAQSKGTWDCVRRLKAVGLEVDVRQVP